jgi:hypothetical protein
VRESIERKGFENGKTLFVVTQKSLASAKAEVAKVSAEVPETDRVSLQV